MAIRGLSQKFLAAMRLKLAHGRAHEYTGWDSRWNCHTFISLTGVRGGLMQKLFEEMAELIIAVDSGKSEAIIMEAADVANMAMMIADIHDDKA